MAIKTLNTVGGLSVGWQSSSVILSNADVNPNNLTVTATATLGNIGNVRIFGGSDGQVLRTDGTGNLSWISGTAGSPGGSNTQIQFNDAGAFNGVSNFTYDKTTSLLTVNGNVVVGDNTNNVSLFSSGAISSTGNFSAANINTGGVLSVTGNANVGNIGATNGVFTNIGGTLTTQSQPNITEVGELTALNVTGNVTVGSGVGGSIIGANLLSANTLSISGNANVGNLNANFGYFANDAVVNGNLSVNGNLTYLNVETVSIQDPIIELQTGANGAAPTSNSGKDVGTALNYYDTGAKIAFMGWDVSNAEIAFGANVAISSEVVTFTELANIRSGNTLTTGVFATTISASGNANVGNLDVGIITTTGNVTAPNFIGNLIGNGTGVANGTSSITIPVAGGNILFATNNTANRMVISDTGNVGIGTSNPAYELEVVGTLAATSKSFLITHPTKPGWKLQYGSLESPYHGVRLTGEAAVVNGYCLVNLPDYIHGLVKQEGAQVQLTPIKHGKVLWVEEIKIDKNYFIVKSNKYKKYQDQELKFYWSFTATRQDISDLAVEWDAE